LPLAQPRGRPVARQQLSDIDLPVAEADADPSQKRKLPSSGRPHLAGHSPPRNQTWNKPQLRRREIDKVLVVRLIMLQAMTLLGCVFFRPIFFGWSFFVPPVVGAVIAFAAVGFFCDRFGASNSFGAGAQVAAFVVVVPGLISLPDAKYGLPFPATIISLFHAVVDGPANLLSAPIPAVSEQELLAVPVVAAWVGVLISWLLARRNWPIAAIVGPAFTLVAAIAFGPLEQGALRLATFVFLLAAVGYLVVVNRMTGLRPLIQKSRFEGVRNSGSAILVVVPIALVACVVGPLLPFASSHQRFALRKYRTPPFDPTALSSPLADYRKFLTDGFSNKVMFEASGDLPERWRLASLGAYDGRVWSVGSGADGSGGRFELVGARMDPFGAERVQGKTKTTTVTIKALNEPWLPMAGKGVALDVGPALRSRLRHNPTSDVLAWETGVAEQAQYRFDWREEKAALVPADGDRPDFGVSTNAVAADLPEQLRQFAAEAVEGASSDSEKASLLQKRLLGGYYSLNTRPGHSYGDLLQLTAEPARMVGNEEQYTAAFALLGQSLGLPVRVVVGFVPPKTSATSVKVFGRDIQTWAEVKFADAGWVRYSVTPAKSRTPKPRAAENESEIDAPPPVFDTVPQPLEPAGSSGVTPKKPEPKKATKKGTGIPRAVKVVAAVTLAPSFVVATAIGLLVALKARRRRRRRAMRSPSLRIAGGWHELLDRLSETGTVVPADATFAGVCRLVPNNELLPMVEDIASQSERAAFHSVPPSVDDATSVWDAVDQLRASLKNESSRKVRIQRAMFLGSLTKTRSLRDLRRAQ
jgi:transglutaminase-like putative cysteine protease